MMTIERIPTETYFLKLPHYVENPVNLTYSTPDAMCFDICAAISEPLTLKPGERSVVPTGLKLIFEHPLWYRVCSRSGLAVNHGIITIAGIIDNDYRGELKIVMLNTNAESSKEDYTIHPGDKIAQIELPFPYQAHFTEISPEKFECMSHTARSGNGFGSTGK